MVKPPDARNPALGVDDGVASIDDSGVTIGDSGAKGVAGEAEAPVAKVARSGEGVAGEQPAIVVATSPMRPTNNTVPGMEPAPDFRREAEARLNAVRIGLTPVIDNEVATHTVKTSSAKPYCYGSR